LFARGSHLAMCDRDTDLAAVDLHLAGVHRSEETGGPGDRRDNGEASGMVRITHYPTVRIRPCPPFGVEPNVRP
jgi:hypothetical protein